MIIFSRNRHMLQSLKGVVTIFVVSTFLNTSALLAAPGEWMPEARLIANIVIEGDAGGTALLVIEGGVPANYIPAACNSPYNTLDLSTSKGRGQLATALTAYTTGRPIRLALSCIGDRPLVTHIML